MEMDNYKTKYLEHNTGGNIKRVIHVKKEFF